MTLADKLQALVAASAEKIPPPMKAIMARNTEALVNSGLAEAAPKAGDAAPALALAGPDGEVSLAALLENGPLVLTWFRGNW